MTIEFDDELDPQAIRDFFAPPLPPESNPFLYLQAESADEPAGEMLTVEALAQQFSIDATEVIARLVDVSPDAIFRDATGVIVGFSADCADDIAGQVFVARCESIATSDEAQS